MAMRENGGGDPVKELFDAGVKILGAAGVKEGPARGLIGRLRQHHGDEDAMRLLMRAARTTDPRAWLARTLVADDLRENYAPGGRR